MDRSRQIKDFTLKLFQGTEMNSVFPELAKLRIQIFRDFPYLYEGDLEYEKKYLKRYSNSSRGFLAALYDADNNMIGAATALPLSDEEEFVQNPFLKSKLPIHEIFYFGESVLLPEYRGQGLGHVFFDEREKFSLSFSDYKITTFCAVQRSSDHPLRPTHYKPLNEFWEKRGYKIQPELQSEFSWADLDSKNETLKKMQYWIKRWKS